VAGIKTFEVRKADRPFAVADLLELDEVVPQTSGPPLRTGRVARARVTYLFHDEHLLAGHVVMGIRFEGVTE
jgi:hypothetical protein